MNGFNNVQNYIRSFEEDISNPAYFSTFTQLTPEELADLQTKIQTLELMNMKLFNEKLKLINENYPLTLPPWVILGGQVISGAFILTEITLMVWFCLKHRKSMTTLLKIALPLARNDPKIIEHLI